MTIEKAIKYLEEWRECYRNSIDTCTAQAIGMAINALENEADRKTEQTEDYDFRDEEDYDFRDEQDYNDRWQTEREGE